MLAALKKAIHEFPETRYDIYLAGAGNGQGELTNFLVTAADEVGIVAVVRKDSVPLYVPWSGISRLMVRGI